MEENFEISILDKKEDMVLVEWFARRVWTEHYSPIVGFPQVRYMLDKYQTAQRIWGDIAEGGYTYYIVRYESEIIGYCAVKPDDTEGLFLSKLYVEKDFRGRGISRKIINMLSEICKNQCHKYIWLTVHKKNTDSIKAYHKMGFYVAEEVVTDIGEGFFMDDYRMKMDIV
ncbi:ribosomal protein S18 acetylase RimI-like enzyme [Anaerobacterium chartisolvens]|uniref:Ribosomal protein S18 acetylase RimI-like enzyme n=1 Tax=Anaerobacterium chartisolvens TaxID=1297424 RepID=A0A369BD34_9FIRM|nr:GNAT family N-acetyltransferase [Anaerobacterium chartisolvens]RCX17584.1 ribosomal protein S18 acetylase RimI-like enzyme [Anaerobacterium chartisolvens]